MRFDAVLFDAGGVLVLPDPLVLGPLLSWYGASPDVEVHRRAHYAGMAAKSRAAAAEVDWTEYDRGYVTAAGVSADDVEEAAFVLGRTRHAHLWRWPIPGSAAALAALDAADVPIGVVSNASGQIEAVLHRAVICQVGVGPGVPVRCVVDSHVVGVAKPDPGIFEHALVHFEGIERSRIAYVGDSVVMDVDGATAAGLTPVLVDPYDDHPELDALRVVALDELVDLVLGGE
jgi:putative hydrolase of the HAD superfamily